VATVLKATSAAHLMDVNVKETWLFSGKKAPNIKSLGAFVHGAGHFYEQSRDVDEVPLTQGVESHSHQ